MDKFWERYIQSRPAPGASKGAFDAFAAEHRDPEPRTLVADASTEMEQSPDSFLRPKRYDILTGLDVPAETLEDWDPTFRKPNAHGGRIGFADKNAGKLVKKGGRPIATEGPSAYIRQVLENLPKDSKFDAEKLAREIIKKFPDSSKSFIDKRDGSVSTSTIYKVIQRDKSLIPLKLKPYNLKIFDP
mgnify:CR=1 FL=1